MKLSKTCIAVVAVAGLLALTSAVRAQTNATTNAAPSGKGGKGGMSVDAQLERINTAVTLTEEQKPKVKAVLEEQNKQMQALRADTALAPEDRRTKMTAIREDTTKKMKEILTAEQFTKYEAIPPMGGRGGKGGKKGGGGGGGGGGQ